jgi:predicted transcriptional regulator
LIETLERERECDLKDLYAVVGASVTPQAVRTLIAQLIQEGLVRLLETTRLDPAA